MSLHSRKPKCGGGNLDLAPPPPKVSQDIKIKPSPGRLKIEIDCRQKSSMFEPNIDFTVTQFVFVVANTC